MTTIQVMSANRLTSFVSSFQNISTMNRSLISIADPNDNFVYVPDGIFSHGILRLQFHDVDEVHEYMMVGDRKMTYYPMNENQAQEVARFVNNVWDKIDCLIVQCHAGISRSAGIAAAISKHYFQDDAFYFGFISPYIPNRKCYSLVLEALYVYGDQK